MILILHHYHDDCAGWLAEGLQAAGYEVRMLDERSLAGLSLSHRLDRRGRSLTGIALGAEPLPEPDLVVNRLISIPPWATGLEAEEDAGYAAAEWQAALCSWLQGLGRRVVNRPDPTTLAGRLPGFWPTGSSGRALSIVDGTVLGAAGHRLAARMVDVAARAGCRMAGFSIDGDRIVSATPVPDLRLHGEQALSACLHLLREAA
jgi:hypothetical protein